MRLLSSTIEYLLLLSPHVNYCEPAERQPFDTFALAEQDELGQPQLRSAHENTQNWIVLKKNPQPTILWSKHITQFAVGQTST